MSNVSIRTAEPGDIPAITAIYAAAVRLETASFEIDPPDEPEMRRRMQGLLGENYPYIVAVLDSAVAGFAYAGPYRLRPAFRFTVEDSIYVAREMQRRGIGRQLLAALIAV